MMRYSSTGVHVKATKIGKRFRTAIVGLVAAASIAAIGVVGFGGSAAGAYTAGAAFSWAPKTPFTWQAGTWQMVAKNQADSVLTFQSDGNLVLHSSGKAVWNTKTNGRGATLAMQRDGNVVVYSSTGHALWASNTVANSHVSSFLLQLGVDTYNYKGCVALSGYVDKQWAWSGWMTARQNCAGTYQPNEGGQGGPQYI